MFDYCLNDEVCDATIDAIKTKAHNKKILLNDID